MATHVNTSAIKNITEYPNSFKRQGAFPLERYSLFNSYEEARDYVKNNPIAYIGQIVSVAIAANDVSGTVASAKAYIVGVDEELHELAQGDSSSGASSDEVEALKARCADLERKVSAASSVTLPPKDKYTINDLWDVLFAMKNALNGAPVNEEQGDTSEP